MGLTLYGVKFLRLYKETNNQPENHDLKIKKSEQTLKEENIIDK